MLASSASQSQGARLPQRNEGSPRDSKGTQSPRPLTQQSPKLCLFLGKPSQISILAPQILWRQAWDCLLVSIVTGNREPPAAVWGYHRHQYLQVHTCPENPWDGAASSLPPCTCMPLYSMHIQGCQYMFLCKYTNTPAYVDACTVTQPGRAHPQMGQEIILQDVTHSHNHPVHPGAEKFWGRRRFYLQHPLQHS